VAANSQTLCWGWLTWCEDWQLLGAYRWTQWLDLWIHLYTATAIIYSTPTVATCYCFWA